MPVIRVQKTKGFTVMAKHHLKDKNLSLKAKGLLSVMLSLPEKWDYTVAGLTAICKESKNTIQTTLKELEKYRYLTREMKRDEHGQFNCIYNIYEKPKEDKGSTPDRDQKTVHGLSVTDNSPQLNNKELNTDDISITKVIEMESTLKNCS